MDYAIILEWDNPVFDNAGSLQREVLQALAPQIRSQARTGEVLIVFDDRAIAEAGLADLVRQELSDVAVRLIRASGHRYYQQKNRGVRESQARIVVFLDSDVVPEPGWLNGLLEALDMPEVQVAAGTTYLRMEGLYGRIMAMIWIFPLRSEESEVKRAHNFFANNLALRRDAAIRNPFPELHDSYRGSLREMRRGLEDNSGGIWVVPAARTMHPPPERGSFIRRAVHHGADIYLTERRRRGSGGLGTSVGAGIRLARRGTRSAGRCLKEWRRVGLRPYQLPLALCVNAAYVGLMYLGALRASIQPEWQKSVIERSEGKGEALAHGGN